MAQASFVALFLAIMTLSLSDWIHWQRHIDDRRTPTIALLRDVLVTLPRGDEVTVTGHSDRARNVSIWGSFAATVREEEVIDLYARELAARGWTKKSGSKREKVALPIYCKNGISLSVHRDDYYRRVSIVLAWTITRGAAEYCP